MKNEDLLLKRVRTGLRLSEARRDRNRERLLARLASVAAAGTAASAATASAATTSAATTGAAGTSMGLWVKALVVAGLAVAASTAVVVERTAEEIGPGATAGANAADARDVDVRAADLRAADLRVADALTADALTADARAAEATTQVVVSEPMASLDRDGALEPAREPPPIAVAPRRIDRREPVRVPEPLEHGARPAEPVIEAMVEPPAPLDDVGREMALLRRARAALSRDDVPAALALLEEHERLFAAGLLSEDRDLLRVRSRCALDDRAGAEREAQRFVAAHPTSSYVDRMTSPCD